MQIANDLGRCGCRWIWQGRDARAKGQLLSVVGSTEAGGSFGLRSRLHQFNAINGLAEGGKLKTLVVLRGLFEPGFPTQSTFLISARSASVEAHMKASVLQPFDPAEAIGVAEAAARSGKSDRTIRNWCMERQIGRRIAGQWAVSAVALDMLLAGDDDSLQAYLAGDRSSGHRGLLSAPLNTLKQSAADRSSKSSFRHFRLCRFCRCRSRE